MASNECSRPQDPIISSGLGGTGAQIPDWERKFLLHIVAQYCGTPLNIQKKNARQELAKFGAWMTNSSWALGRLKRRLFEKKRRTYSGEVLLSPSLGVSGALDVFGDGVINLLD